MHRLVPARQLNDETSKASSSLFSIAGLTPWENVLRTLILRRLTFLVVGLSSAWVGERQGPCYPWMLIVGMNNGNVGEPPSVSGTDLACGEKPKIGSGQESCVCRSDRWTAVPQTLNVHALFQNLQESQLSLLREHRYFPAWENAAHPHAGPRPIRHREFSPHILRNPNPNLQSHPSRDLGRRER